LNFAGQAAPLALGIVAIPILLRTLGLERFGLLAIVWAFLGYFSIFDLGLGRALTKLVADRSHLDDPTELRALIWSALLLMVAVGIAGGIAIWTLSPLLLNEVIRPPTALRAESQVTLFWLSIGVPVVTCSSGLRGVLEAKQRFGWVGAVRLVLGISTFVGPLLVLPFSKSLAAIVPVLVASRLLATVVSFAQCQRIIPGFAHPMVRPTLFPTLLRYGSWMTVSNVIGPLMTYLDRFFIAAVLSLSAVAYYVTPYELTARLTVVPASVAGVLFPAFASANQGMRTRVPWLFTRGTLFMGVIWFGVCMCLLAVTRPAMILWLGPAFSSHAIVVLQVLVLATFVNGMAYIPFALIQATGRADVTAKLHLAELPMYLAGLVVMVHFAGIVGAATMALARASADFLLLLYFSGRVTALSLQSLRGIGLGVVIGCIALGLTLMPVPEPLLVLYALTVITAVVVVSWKRLLVPAERAVVVGFATRLSLGRLLG